MKSTGKSITGLKKMKKEGMRMLAFLLSVIVFLTSLPMHVLEARAELQSNWKDAGMLGGWGVYQVEFGNGFFLAINYAGEVYKSMDGEKWDSLNVSVENDDGMEFEYYHEYFYLYDGDGTFLGS